MFERLWAAKKDEESLYIGLCRIFDTDPDRAKCRVVCAAPIVFQDSSLYETNDKTAMYTVSNTLAVGLMNDLWKAGIRPTEMEGE